VSDTGITATLVRELIDQVWVHRGLDALDKFWAADWPVADSAGLLQQLQG
jgi:hypothetical protein